MERTFQINQLSNDISYLGGKIRVNNEKIARLEDAKADIIRDQSELGSQRKLASEPDLSAETWQGKHAGEFLNKREVIEQEYTNIVDVQVETLLDNIATEMGQLQELNGNYSSSIESKRYQINNLRNK